MPIASATADMTSAGSVTGASGTNQAPSAYRPRTRSAISDASLLFPMPGGPMIVTSESRSTSFPISWTSDEARRWVTADQDRERSAKPDFAGRAPGGQRPRAVGRDGFARAVGSFEPVADLDAGELGPEARQVGGDAERRIDGASPRVERAACIAEGPANLAAGGTRQQGSDELGLHLVTDDRAVHRTHSIAPIDDSREHHGHVRFGPVGLRVLLRLGHASRGDGSVSVRNVAPSPRPQRLAAARVTVSMGQRKARPRIKTMARTVTATTASSATCRQRARLVDRPRGGPGRAAASSTVAATQAGGAGWAMSRSWAASAA
jgi:hypothetical protein